MQLSLEYLAGFFDGEGSVSITRHQKNLASGKSSWNHVLMVQVTQCDIRVLVAFKERFGGQIYPKAVSKSTKRGKPAFEWHAGSKIAEKCLTELLPFLFIKKPEAEIALEFRRTLVHGNKGQGIRLIQTESEKREVFRQKIIAIHGPSSRAVV